MEQELFEEVKSTYLDIAPNDTEMDELIHELIDYVEGFIYVMYGVAIFERSIVEKVATFYNSHLYFTKKGMISSIESVTMDGEDVTSEILPYVFFDRNELFLSNTSTIMFRKGSDTRLTYKIGYANIDDIPKGLKNALYQTIKKLYTDITKNIDSFSAMSSGIKESVKIEDSLPFVVKQVLESYRIYRL